MYKRCMLKHILCWVKSSERRWGIRSYRAWWCTLSSRPRLSVWIPILFRFRNLAFSVHTRSMILSGLWSISEISLPWIINNSILMKKLHCPCSFSHWVSFSILRFQGLVDRSDGWMILDRALICHFRAISTKSKVI